MSIRTIVQDDLFLQRKSVQASKQDSAIVTDLLDTIQANHARCIGLAANMIGELKRIIVVQAGDVYLTMYNPEIVKHSARAYQTQEGCLCRSIELPCTRYETIEVKYRDQDFRKQRQKFSGLIAETIQHEIDHCDGKLI